MGAVKISEFIYLVRFLTEKKNETTKLIGEFKWRNMSSKNKQTSSHGCIENLRQQRCGSGENY